MSAKVIRLVEGVHMGLSHDGLAKLLKKAADLDVRALEMGELVLCMNRKGDKLKLIGSAGLVIGYLKMPGGMRIYKEALQYIPQTFGAKGFDYATACKMALDKALYQPKKRISALDYVRKLNQ